MAWLPREDLRVRARSGSPVTVRAEAQRERHRRALALAGQDREGPGPLEDEGPAALGQDRLDHDAEGGLAGDRRRAEGRAEHLAFALELNRGAQAAVGAEGQLGPEQDATADLGQPFARADEADRDLTLFSAPEPLGRSLGDELEAKAGLHQRHDLGTGGSGHAPFAWTGVLDQADAKGPGRGLYGLDSACARRRRWIRGGTCAGSADGPQLLSADQEGQATGVRHDLDLAALALGAEVAQGLGRDLGEGRG